ncbi:hypothetical protein [Flavobacterium wongokense]|uniref:hypothetical protein n=1 Tax=Flavobacterium wongokense TaxID=2910674 RepID=UPI001F37D390|nr:hypothetical protein [Flavobacterium sp. WG47]MCF6131301.1 hypothetical protein [Flavobacterium sp. WG47]
MKKGIFNSIAIILFVFIGHSQEKCEFKSGSIVTRFNNEVIEYKFKSLEDLDKEIEEIVKEFDFSGLENKKDNCKIAIELKLEIGIGVNTVLLSQIMTVNCESESATIIAKKLKQVLLAAVI